MGQLLLKIFAIFWAVWIAWYLTGGPLRNEGNSPYVQYDQNGQIIQMSTTTKNNTTETEAK